MYLHCSIVCKTFSNRRIIFFQVQFELVIDTSLLSKTCFTPGKGTNSDKPFHFPALYISNDKIICNRKPVNEGFVPGAKGNASVSLAGEVGRLL